MTKYYTHEEMLETVVGKKGTTKRDEFESKLKAGNLVPVKINIH